MIGENIKARLNAAKMTQVALAKKVGVTEATMSMWCKNINKPNAENMAKLADALECSVEELKGERKEPVYESKENVSGGVYRGLKYNSSGYADPTAFNAITNALADEAQREIQRGDIYYVAKNSEPGAPNRPAVIVSPNGGGRCIAVVYLTRKNVEISNAHVKIMCKNDIATAMCEQITTVWEDRLRSYICTCTDEEMTRIDAALLAALGLEGKAGHIIYHAKDSAEENARFAELSDKITKLEAENDELRHTPTAADGYAENIVTERDLYKRMYEQIVDKIIARGAF